MSWTKRIQVSPDMRKKVENYARLVSLAALAVRYDIPRKEHLKIRRELGL